MSTKKLSGFTIVELLIVIVVIGILATVAVVAYSGMRQRANNAAIISAANNSLRMINVYVAQNGTYPFAWTADACITSTTGCDVGTASVTSSSAFDTAIATVGTVPRSIPKGSPAYGIYMSYHLNATYNGVSAPARLSYFLFGTNQQCGITGVQTYTWPTYQSSSTGYTAGDLNGQTVCWINIPGPGA